MCRHFQLLGKILCVDHQPEALLVSSASSYQHIIARLDPLTGEIIWRRFLGHEEILLDINANGKHLATLSSLVNSSLYHLRLWDTISGGLQKQWDLIDVTPTQIDRDSSCRLHLLEWIDNMLFAAVGGRLARVSLDFQEVTTIFGSKDDDGHQESILYIGSMISTPHKKIDLVILTREIYQGLRRVILENPTQNQSVISIFSEILVKDLLGTRSFLVSNTMVAFLKRSEAVIIVEGLDSPMIRLNRVILDGINKSVSSDSLSLSRLGSHRFLLTIYREDDSSEDYLLIKSHKGSSSEWHLSSNKSREIPSMDLFDNHDILSSSIWANTLSFNLGIEHVSLCSELHTIMASPCSSRICVSPFTISIEFLSDSYDSTACRYMRERTTPSLFRCVMDNLSWH